MLMSPERKLFWKTAGLALLLLLVVLLLVLFGWSLAQPGAAVH
jgi:predicted negative regulator of RcsB-dependent stress response